jgi:hypothetical protein
LTAPLQIALATGSISPKISGSFRNLSGARVSSVSKNSRCSEERKTIKGSVEQQVKEAAPQQQNSES